MDIISRLNRHFEHLIEPTPQDLKQAIENVAVTREDLHPHLGAPSIYPYGRKLLYKSNDIEVLVMNWAFHQECAPHDHGNSYGWVTVISGEATHTLYTLNHKSIPLPWLRLIEKTHHCFFAQYNPTEIRFGMETPFRIVVLKRRVLQVFTGGEHGRSSLEDPDYDERSDACASAKLDALSHQAIRSS